jgi:transcriptional regulator with PAS, ATPase and Fis domain
MRKIFERIRLAAPTTSTVLITGESGTGKELVARAIHQNSLVKHGPFVAVNCGALPETLVESELFGHEKGAFTGALQLKKGFFEAAEKGTLLIDEVGDLPLALQPKLLRALEQRVITRVGSTRETPVDVRILAATHQQLEQMVRENRFRADLYFRLSVVSIDLPPLRERREDLRPLVAFLLDQLATAAGTAACEIGPQVLEALEKYGWPGNVRELRNVLESMVVLNTSGRIGLEDLPAHVLRHREPTAAARQDSAFAGRTLAATERAAILETLEHCGGNRTHAAQVLGIGLRTIQRKLREYGLD